jgi:hypothetical protein
MKIFVLPAKVAGLKMKNWYAKIKRGKFYGLPVKAVLMAPCFKPKKLKFDSTGGMRK